MYLYNIRCMKFFLTRLDCVAVNVKPWPRLRRSCPVVLGGGRRKWRTWSGLCKIAKNMVLSEDLNIVIDMNKQTVAVMGCGYMTVCFSCSIFVMSLVASSPCSHIQFCTAVCCDNLEPLVANVPGWQTLFSASTNYLCQTSYHWQVVFSSWCTADLEYTAQWCRLSINSVVVPTSTENIPISATFPSVIFVFQATRQSNDWLIITHFRNKNKKPNSLNVHTVNINIMSILTSRRMSDLFATYATAVYMNLFRLTNQE